LNLAVELAYGVACWWIYRGRAGLLIGIVVFNVLNIPTMGQLPSVTTLVVQPPGPAAAVDRRADRRYLGVRRASGIGQRERRSRECGHTRIGAPVLQVQRAAMDEITLPRVQAARRQSWP
jgi:hypothetical protein